MGAALADLLAGYSMEVIPRTAAKIERFADHFAAGTRLTIAHVDGTAIEAMAATARRIAGEGFEAMPHIPARSVPSREALDDWIARYREAGVDSALLIAGGRPRPAGPFASAQDLLETGAFAPPTFRRLHFAGHPEGNALIDRDGSGTALLTALRQKADYAAQTGLDAALVTQFAFDARAVTDWIGRIRQEGIALPVHVGVAAPATLSRLLKYALLCGVGPSVAILQKRARDVTKLMRPFEPTAILEALAQERAQRPELGIKRIHLYPFDGVASSAAWANAKLAQRG